MRFTTDLKFQKCPKCSGVANTQGAPLTRSIFYLGDRFDKDPVDVVREPM